MFDIFVFLLFLLLAWGAKKVPYEAGFLSLNTSKQIKGWFALVIVLHHLALAKQKIVPNALIDLCVGGVFGGSRFLFL